MSLVKKLKLLVVSLLSLSVLITVVFGFLAAFPPEAMAQTAGGMDPEVVKWGYMAAALVTGLSALGAGIAVGSVGAAAIGAVAEKSELFGRALVLVGLAEGIAIYGLIISIIILNRVG